MKKLKVKFLNFSAGRPVAILNKEFASNNNIHIDDRISVHNNGKNIIAVVDLASGFLKQDEIVVSMEVVNNLKIREKENISIDIASKPESINLIYEKLSCKNLQKKEITKIIKDIVNNAITESEIAFFVSAVYKCGMSMKEIEYLTEALVKTGKTLKLKGEVADKHSVGGIPGRTTPIVVSICASTGLTIPKTSSRAITSPAGTADAVETLCKVDFSLSEMKKIIKKTNACLVWGGSLNLAPADDKIIQIERLIHLDPEAQLLASIISKKLSVGSKYVLIDIPYGKYAKFSKITAKNLGKKFERLGKHFKIKIKSSLRQVDEPLGNGIGPSLEMSDVLSVLKRESSCHLLESRSLELAGELLELTGKAEKGKGKSLAKNILDSGKAYKKFTEIIEAQKGKISQLSRAEYKREIFAERSMKIKSINIKEINNVASIAGCPADKKAGIYLYKHLNDSVRKGEKILEIYSETKSKLDDSYEYYKISRPIR